MRIEQAVWTQLTGWVPEPPGRIGTSAQLVLLFGSPTVLKATDYLNDLKPTYPNAHIIGCSTAGEICGTQVLDDSLVMTAIHFEQTQVQCHSVRMTTGEDSFTVGERLGNALNPEGLVHVFMLSDGLQVNGSDLVRGLVQQIPPGVTVTGGLSGDGDRFQETLVLADGQPESGLVTVVGLYGDRLRVGYGSAGGWKAFGPKRVITKSAGNTLYQLDQQPALELYKKYLGDHADGLPATGLLFPLSLCNSVNDHSIVRSILSVNEAEQSLTFAGDVPEGTTVQLMQASFQGLVEGAIDAAEISARVADDDAPELAILISCIGRKLALKQQIEEEVEGVREVLGDQTVLTGFYSYGEIAPFTSGIACDLHNQTMTISTFSER